MARKYESEIKELREQNADLEMKNQKYLEIIGLTATEQHEDVKLKMEAAQNSLSFAKRTKRFASKENNDGEDIQILEEMEEMLEI